MTATVNFENPQVQVGDGTTGIEISPIIIPYSIRDAENPLQYLGGQVVLTKEDGVAFSDNTADWYKKALVKIKKMVADTEIYVPDPIIEVPEELPESSAVEAPASSAEASKDTVDTSVSSEASEAPASSADDLVASSEATVVSSAPVTEAPVEASVTEVQ